MMNPERTKKTSTPRNPDCATELKNLKPGKSSNNGALKWCRTTQAAANARMPVSAVITGRVLDSAFVASTGDVVLT
jgi:hypothetical protein